MMSIQQTRGFATICKVLSRSYGRSFSARLTSPSSYIRKRTLYNQVRLLCSKNEDLSSLDLLKQIQTDLGGPVSSVPSFKNSSGEEKTFLNSELRLLSDLWPELGTYLEGRDLPVETLVTFIEKNLSKCSITALCSLIPSYLKVFKHETKQFRFVVEEGMKRMPNLTLNEAVLFVNTLCESSAEKLDSKYFAMCEEILKGKLEKVKSTEQVMFAMSMMRKHKMLELNELFDNLLTKDIEKMTDKHVYQLLYSLACEKSRNPIILRTIIMKICQANFSEFSLSELCNLFYSCSMLHLQNTTLLNNMSEHTTRLLGTEALPNRANIKVILKSCAALGWKDDNLLRKINYWLESDKDFARSAERIVSLCHLGYSSVNDSVKQYSKSFKDRDQVLKKEKPMLWLQFIHAKASRGLASVTEIMEVLSPEFYSPLINEKAINVKIMLLNLRGCLELDLKTKFRPVFDTETWTSSIKTLRGKNSLSREVETTLKHITLDTKGPFLDKYGHLIDFEIKYRDPLDEHSGQIKQPVRIRVLEYKDMIHEITGCKASGRTLMAIRHLQAQSTPVVIIPYHRWTSGALSLQQAINLEAQIKTAIVNAKPDSGKKEEQQQKNESADIKEAES